MSDCVACDFMCGGLNCMCGCHDEVQTLDSGGLGDEESYPWTPGPWAWSEGGALRGHDEQDDRVMVAIHPSWSKGPSAQLIALAPVMADAILRFCDTYETDQWFLPVAERLRAIIKEHQQ